jgi:hypothetical protein
VNSGPDDRWPDELERALRRWAGRPSRLAPSEAAARVRARIAAPSRRPPGLLVAAAAAAVALALAAGISERTTSAPPQAAAPALVVGPLPENVVLWWLDAETPVYFVIGPPANGGS